MESVLLFVSFPLGFVCGWFVRSFIKPMSGVIEVERRVAERVLSGEVVRAGAIKRPSASDLKSRDESELRREFDKLKID